MWIDIVSPVQLMVRPGTHNVAAEAIFGLTERAAVALADTTHAQQTMLLAERQRVVAVVGVDGSKAERGYQAHDRQD
jgi:hypothetical protein